MARSPRAAVLWKGMRVSLGCLPSRRLVVAVFCSLTPAVGQRSTEQAVPGVCGVGERPWQRAETSQLCGAPAADITLVVRNSMWCKDLDSWV